MARRSCRVRARRDGSCRSVRPGANGRGLAPAGTCTWSPTRGGTAARRPGRLDLGVLAAGDPRGGLGRSRGRSPVGASGDSRRRAHVRHSAARDRRADVPVQRVEGRRALDADRLPRGLAHQLDSDRAAAPRGGRQAPFPGDGGDAQGVRRDLRRGAQRLARHRCTRARVHGGDLEHRRAAGNRRRAARETASRSRARPASRPTACSSAMCSRPPA